MWWCRLAEHKWGRLTISETGVQQSVSYLGALLCTVVHCDANLVLDTFRNVKPVQIVVNELWQTMVELMCTSVVGVWRLITPLSNIFSWNLVVLSQIDSKRSAHNLSGYIQISHFYHTLSRGLLFSWIQCTMKFNTNHGVHDTSNWSIHHSCTE